MILLTLALVFLGFQIIGPLIGFFVALPFYPKGMVEMANALQDPTGQPEFKIPYFIIQGFGTLTGLIVLPLLLLRSERKTIRDFFPNNTRLLSVGLVFFIVVSFVVVNSIFIEWNMNVHLPKFLSGFETWARSLEDKLATVTQFLTTFDSTTHLIIALIVVAVLPGIGEELVFRGMLQNQFMRATQNIHLSIWVSAILFSAIHLQFFGFVPRMLLGALFGYLYYWSGNLLLAMIAHFVNNAFSVLALYYYQQGSIDMNVESTEAAPWQAIVVSVIISVGLLYYFKKFHSHSSRESIL